MNRFFRVSALAAAVLALAVPAVANIPDATLSVVPTFVTIAPDGGGSVVNVTIQVNGALGGVDGAYVTLEFSEDATALIAWSDPVPVGADVPTQTCPTRVYAKAANSFGTAVFHIAGGGCVVEPAYAGTIYISEVKADDIVLAQREVNSPDVVNGSGYLPTDDDPNNPGSPLGPVCDAGVMSVSLADAVFHAPSVKSGSYDDCSDLAAPYGGTIDLGDAGVITVYIKAGSSAACFIGCP